MGREGGRKGTFRKAGKWERKERMKLGERI